MKPLKKSEIPYDEMTPKPEPKKRTARKKILKKPKKKPAETQDLAPMELQT
jgi:hypothetical protein